MSVEPVETERRWRARVKASMVGFIARPGRFYQALHAIHRSNLSGNARQVLIAILDKVSTKGPIPFPSVAELAAATDRGTTTVKAAVRELERGGIISTRRRWNDSSLFDVSALNAEESKVRQLLGVETTQAEATLGPDNSDPRRQASDAGSPGDHQTASEGRQASPNDPIPNDSRDDASLPAGAGTKPLISSSAAPSSKASAPKRKRAPKDAKTLDLENHYCRRYHEKKGVAWHGLKDPKTEAQARIAFKSIWQGCADLAEAKAVIDAVFANPNKAEKYCAPWQIYQDLSNLRGKSLVVGFDAGISCFPLRGATEAELQAQAKIAGEDLATIQQCQRGECRLNPAWLFDRGLNPENTEWLNRDDNAVNQWAIGLYAKHRILSPRMRAMLSDVVNRKQWHDIAFDACITPDSYPAFVLWNTTETKQQAKRWLAEWQVRRRQEEARKETGT
jgi:DNA-binding MarR family transcriptional regulator